MTARISLIPGKARGHRPRLQFIAIGFAAALFSAIGLASQQDGTTPLHLAVQRDDLATAAALIQAGADPRVANRDGATPMFLAAMNGSAAMIETLLKAGVDANAPVLGHGETALMMAARTGKVEAVRVLVDHGAQLNAKETLRGTTALMW